MDGYEHASDDQCVPIDGSDGSDGSDDGDGGFADGIDGGGADTDGGTGTDGGSGTGDDGGSGSGTTDGGETDGGPGPSGVTLEPGEIVVCDNPGDRAAAPFVAVEWGSAWNNQNHESSTSDPIAASGLTLEDFDGDGILEIYIPQVGDDQFFVRQSDGTYADEASTRLPTGLDTASTAGTAFDVELDGDLDLLITRRVGGVSLLINDGSGHFSDGTDAAMLDGAAHPAVAATVADMDQDGDLDIFIITYRHCDMMGWDPDNPYGDDPQALWENQGDGTFVDISDTMPAHPGVNGRLRAAAWFDADLNGVQDLYTISDRGFTSECMVTNQLFFSGSGGFTEDAASVSLNLGMEGMGVSLGDINGDAYPDIALSDMSRAWLMVSDGVGGWYDAAMASRLFVESDTLGQWTGWGTEFADFNNDGLVDLFMGFGGLADVDESEMNPWEQPDALWLQDGDGYFSQVSTEWGVAGAASTRAVIATDINQDGWLDLATREIAGPALVWLAQCGSNSWIDVRLEQSGGNPNGLGAKVKVTVSDHSQAQWLTRGASGLQSSEPVRAHFGLGSATSVDLQVSWPDGEISTFEAVDVNQTVRVVRNP